MTRSLPSRVEAVFWLLSSALGYHLLASLSLYATKGTDNIAAIWPASGYFLGLLLIMPKRAYVAAFIGMLAANLSANLVAGTPLWTSAAFSLANGSEAAIALWILRRPGAGKLSFMAPRSVRNFCVAALSASIASAVLAVIFAGGGLDFFLSWMTTVGLGMLIVTPPMVMLRRLTDTKALQSVGRAMKVEAAAILVGAALVTAGSFYQSQFPTAFIPCVAVVIAAYRLGPIGAGAGMLIVTAIASLMTGQGYGPIAAVDAAPKVKVFFLQFYLVTLLFTVLPLAALLVMRQRLAKRLEQSNRWLLQAEAAALVGHWRVDLVRWTIRWSDQAYRIHGLEPGAPVGVNYSVEQYLPDDQVAVKKILRQAVRTGEPFEYEGRIRRADGEIRHVKSHGSIEVDRSGTAIGIFGTIQDVTEMVENARILVAARSAAERAANTDILTGLPNRRHTLAFLEKALVQARDHGAPFAVAIFDIDHFKQINDSHGHAMGDRVIRHVAERARAALRDEDILGRIGGEEFVCILAQSSAQAAEIVAERVRKAVETGTASEDDLPDTTISIGLAVYEGEPDIEELLHRADEALYAAKREGRNRLRSAA
jgi:diguanylate cyclase (GGDEF)-like protein/PAS domain S-box-containing protein